MTKFTTRMMIAAAAMTVAAGAAAAQTLKAEIPFNFRAGEKMMPAGTYTVINNSQLTGSNVFRLSNPGRKTAVLVVPTGAEDPKKSWREARTPVLEFECAASSCSLATLWSGSGRPAYAMRRKKMGNEAPTRMATIVMRPQRSE